MRAVARERVYQLCYAVVAEMVAPLVKDSGGGSWQLQHLRVPELPKCLKNEPSLWKAGAHLKQAMADRMQTAASKCLRCLDP
jgi:hypothetical protein